MAEIKPRYEFRTWAETLVPLRKRLECLAQPRETVSQEIYLVSARTDRCNAKIRSDLMDIKILIAEDRGLEQWKPVLKAGFPLDRSVIADQVFPNLDLRPPVLSEIEYALEKFLREVIAPEPRITIVNVSKTRHQFNLETCQAEFASVTFNHLERDTVAVESADPDAALQLIWDLGIAGEANTSYIRELKSVLNLAGV
jgi:exopolyphosphatase/guanosine-5'-triphosphate,3'-diphosphate pyrophosphatase